MSKNWTHESVKNCSISRSCMILCKIFARKRIIEAGRFLLKMASHFHQNGLSNMLTATTLQIWNVLYSEYLKWEKFTFANRRKNHLTGRRAANKHTPRRHGELRKQRAPHVRMCADIRHYAREHACYIIIEQPSVSISCSNLRKRCVSFFIVAIQISVWSIFEWNIRVFSFSMNLALFKSRIFENGGLCFFATNTLVS